MGEKKIVVWDPAGEFWEGSLIDPAKEGAIRTRGGVVLPTTPELFHLSGVGAFMKRAWGSGWPLDQPAFKSCCPMTVYATPLMEVAHWAARLMPDPSAAERYAEGELPSGQIQLVADTPQGNAWRASVRSKNLVQGAALGRPDADGGWSVGGEAHVGFPQDGYYGFALYGMMPGVRVEWAAISLVIKDKAA